MNKKTKVKDYRGFTTRSIEDVFGAVWSALDLGSIGLRRWSAHSGGLVSRFAAVGLHCFASAVVGAMVFRYGRAILARESTMARK